MESLQIIAIGYLLLGMIMGIIVGRRATKKTAKILTLLVAIAVAIALADVIAMFVVKQMELTHAQRDFWRRLLILVISSTNAVCTCALMAGIILLYRKQQAVRALTLVFVSMIPLPLMILAFALSSVVPSSDSITRPLAPHERLGQHSAN